MKIDYNTLTVEQLEEYAEFVDWSMVPCNLITDDVRKSFGFLPALNARLWFEDLLSQMVIKEDQNKYLDRLCYFVDDIWYMNLDLKTGNLWCSRRKVWFALELKTHFNYDKTKRFIKNIVEQYLKGKDQNIRIKPDSAVIIFDEEIEKYFKNKKLQEWK